MQNIFKIINGVIPKEEYKTKCKKRAADSQLESFCSFIDNNENKELFTCLKEKCEKEKYLVRPQNYGNNKLTIATEKWHKKIKK